MATIGCSPFPEAIRRSKELEVLMQPKCKKQSKQNRCKNLPSGRFHASLWPSTISDTIRGNIWIQKKCPGDGTKTGVFMFRWI